MPELSHLWAEGFAWTTVLIVVCAAGALVAFLAAGWGWIDVQRKKRALSRLAIVTGVVRTLQTTFWSDTEGIGKGTTSVAVSFTVGSTDYTCRTLHFFFGNDHVGRQQADWDRPPGTPVGVWYDTANPDISALIVDRPTYARPVVALGLGVFLAVMTAYTDGNVRTARAGQPGRAATMETASAPAALAAGGVVAGRFVLDGATVALTHAAALLHDNAEGNVGRPLTLVLLDRPMPPGTLDGEGEKAVSRLASAGKLRGLMFQIDPSRPWQAALIVLGRPQRAEAGPGSVDIGSKEAPAVSGLMVYADQVQASLGLAAVDAKAMATSFKIFVRAPLVREPPVTVDVEGGAVTVSASWRAAKAYAEAMLAGDVARQERLASAALRSRIAALRDRPATPARIREAGGVMLAQLPRVHRLIERGDRAVLLVDSRAWLTMVKEGGEWKVGD